MKRRKEEKFEDTYIQEIYEKSMVTFGFRLGIVSFPKIGTVRAMQDRY